MQTNPITTPAIMGINTIPIVYALNQNMALRSSAASPPFPERMSGSPQRGHSSCPSGSIALQFGHQIGIQPLNGRLSLLPY
jgi:hypothetical protein